MVVHPTQSHEPAIEVGMSVYHLAGARQQGRFVVVVAVLRRASRRCRPLSTGTNLVRSKFLCVSRRSLADPRHVGFSTACRSHVLLKQLPCRLALFFLCLRFGRPCMNMHRNPTFHVEATDALAHTLLAFRLGPPLFPSHVDSSVYPALFDINYYLPNGTPCFRSYASLLEARPPRPSRHDTVRSIPSFLARIK